MDENTIVIIDDDGNEVEYEIILTFEDPNTKKNYVVYQAPDSLEEVMAAEYIEDEDGSGTLIDVDSDEEFEMIQEVLNTFTEDDEEEA